MTQEEQDRIASQASKGWFEANKEIACIKARRTELRTGALALIEMLGGHADIQQTDDGTLKVSASVPLAYLQARRLSGPEGARLAAGEYECPTPEKAAALMADLRAAEERREQCAETLKAQGFPVPSTDPS